MQAEVVLSYKSMREAKAVAEAISPDNVKIPKGLFIKTRKLRKKVITKITCETRFSTFMATIDDLLGAVSLAEKTISSVKNR